MQTTHQLLLVITVQAVFEFRTNISGQVELVGRNAASANFSLVVSYQSVPLNKWTHIAAQLDMSAFTATTTTSYVMIDGVDVPASVGRSGTNPTALIQAGNLEIGSTNGGTQPFPGYIDQVAVYSAKVTQATILASINRALSGSETSLASAYSNGSVTDLNTTTPNNLTATNGATTVASSPFGNRGVSTTLEYGVVMANTFSTNTTLTIQVPEGCQLPTTGGISSVDYSTQNVPYGFPRQKGRWVLSTLSLIRTAQSSPSSATAYATNIQLGVPTGSWTIGYMAELYVLRAAGVIDARLTLASSSASYSATSLLSGGIYANSVTDFGATITRQAPVSLTTLTTHYLNYYAAAASFTTMSLLGDFTPVVVNAENAYI